MIVEMIPKMIVVRVGNMVLALFGVRAFGSCVTVIGRRRPSAVCVAS